MPISRLTRATAASSAKAGPPPTTRTRTSTSTTTKPPAQSISNKRKTRPFEDDEDELSRDSSTGPTSSTSNTTWRTSATASTAASRAAIATKGTAATKARAAATAKKPDPVRSASRTMTTRNSSATISTAASRAGRGSGGGKAVEIRRLVVKDSVTTVTGKDRDGGAVKKARTSGPSGMTFAGKTAAVASTTTMTTNTAAKKTVSFAGTGDKEKENIEPKANVGKPGARRTTARKPAVPATASSSASAKGRAAAKKAAPAETSEKPSNPKKIPNLDSDDADDGDLVSELTLPLHQSPKKKGRTAPLIMPPEEFSANVFSMTDDQLTQNLLQSPAKRKGKLVGDLASVKAGLMEFQGEDLDMQDKLPQNILASPAKRKGRSTPDLAKPRETSDEGKEFSEPSQPVLMSPAKRRGRSAAPKIGTDEEGSEGLTVLEQPAAPPLMSPAKRNPGMFGNAHLFRPKEETDPSVPQAASSTRLLNSPTKKLSKASVRTANEDGSTTISVPEKTLLIYSPAKRPASPIKAFAKHHEAQDQGAGTANKAGFLQSPAKRAPSAFKFPERPFEMPGVQQLPGVSSVTPEQVSAAGEEHVEPKEEPAESEQIEAEGSECDKSEGKKPSQMLMAGDDTMSDPFRGRGLLFRQAPPSLKLPGRRTGGGLVAKEDLTGDIFAPVRRSTRHRKTEHIDEEEDLGEEYAASDDDEVEDSMTLSDEEVTSGVTLTDAQIRIPEDIEMMLSRREQMEAEQEKHGRDEEGEDEEGTGEQTGAITEFEHTLTIALLQSATRTDSSRLIEDTPIDLAAVELPPVETQPVKSVPVVEEADDSVISEIEASLQPEKPQAQDDLEVEEVVEEEVHEDNQVQHTEAETEVSSAPVPGPAPEPTPRRRVSPRKKIGGAFGLRHKDAAPQLDDSDESEDDTCRLPNSNGSLPDTPVSSRTRGAAGGTPGAVRTRKGGRVSGNGFTPLADRLGRSWVPAEPIVHDTGTEVEGAEEREEEREEEGVGEEQTQEEEYEQEAEVGIEVDEASGEENAEEQELEEQPEELQDEPQEEEQKPELAPEQDQAESEVNEETFDDDDDMEMEGDDVPTPQASRVAGFSSQNESRRSSFALFAERQVEAAIEADIDAELDAETPRYSDHGPPDNPENTDSPIFDEDGFDDLDVTQEDLDLAEEAQEMSLLEPEDVEELNRSYEALEEEMEQEYYQQMGIEPPADEGPAYDEQMESDSDSADEYRHSAISINVEDVDANTDAGEELLQHKEEEDTEMSEHEETEQEVPPVDLDMEIDGREEEEEEADDKQHEVTTNIPPVTPVRFTTQNKELHTVSKMPLKDADESTPSPSKPRRKSFDTPRLLTVRHSIGPVPQSPAKGAKPENFDPKTPARSISAWTPSPRTPITPYVNTPGRVNPEALRGATIFVDVFTADGTDASGVFVELLTQLGAKCVPEWAWDPHDPNQIGKIGITHVVFKEGSSKTLEKVKEAQGVVHCVGVSWVLDCERDNAWVEEVPYYVPSVYSKTPRSARRKTTGMLGSPATPVRPGRRRSSRRQSTVWERTPTESEKGFKDNEEDSPWQLSPVPVTPAPETVARYAAMLPLETPSPEERIDINVTPTQGMYDHDHGYDDEDTDMDDNSGNKVAMMMTCPPPKRTVDIGVQKKLVGVAASTKKPSVRWSEDVGCEKDRKESSKNVMMRLLAARRKSLQFAPKVSSPLAKQWRGRQGGD